MTSLSILSKPLAINFAHGRATERPIDMVVVHVTEGDAASVVSWFNNPEANVSAHYLVRADGKVIQFVDEDDTAWHAGRVDRPTARLVVARPGENPNTYAIGIEHEGDGTHELTTEQRAASVSLIADICRRRAIPVDRDHIVGHHEIYSLKSCPGAISVDRLMQAVFALVESGHAVLPVAAPPRLVWSPYANDYLVVTQYVSDAEWYFVPLSELATLRGQRADTPLSAMPIGAPI